jgi:hypothetical protein
MEQHKETSVALKCFKSQCWVVIVLFRHCSNAQEAITITETFNAKTDVTLFFFFLLFFLNHVINTELESHSWYNVRLQAGQLRIRSSSPVMNKIFLICTLSRPVVWPTNLLSNGYRQLFSQRVKRPGRETDRSPPTSARVKNSLPHMSSWHSAF